MSSNVIGPPDRIDPSDERLLDAIRDRDEQAFDELYLRAAPAIARFAWSVSGSRDTVEELLQETFLSVWRRPEGVRVVNGSALPWLLVTCRNHARNRARRESRQHRAAQRAERSAPSDLTDDAAAIELRWALDSIAHLPDVDRAVCELVLLLGLSYREAADELGISEASVGKRLHRSRRRLRKEVS